MVLLLLSHASVAISRKWITRKEFEAYLRVKEFIEKNNYEEADLRRKFEIGDPLVFL